MLRVNAPIHAQSKAIVLDPTVSALAEDSRQQMRSVSALSAECRQEQQANSTRSHKE